MTLIIKYGIHEMMSSDEKSATDRCKSQGKSRVASPSMTNITTFSTVHNYRNHIQSS